MQSYCMITVSLTAHLRLLNSLLDPRGEEQPEMLLYLSHRIKMYLGRDWVNCPWGFVSRQRRKLLTGPMFTFFASNQTKPRSPDVEESADGLSVNPEKTASGLLIWKCTSHKGWEGFFFFFYLRPLLFGRGRAGVGRRRFKILGSCQYPIWWVTVEQRQQDWKMILTWHCHHRHAIVWIGSRARCWIIDSELLHVHFIQQRLCVGLF